ncbi:corticotropin-releasing factor-binding protein [Anopheles darlingi]|uniref:corticotropin-releasing factor-binding protein n=1 Tax=Anopheles darlingi TaxID=43151 RepID=UPI00210055B6|nr:corticotropin-releasing factor-binding protein [Anopheles darlingi]XP_049531286.1 corticotropin-releasing factor-binding protein [Anopheles darlingi]XP_049531374.1 corticotropin-releasing factor-binding protein [Anopheles darlingi]
MAMRGVTVLFFQVLILCFQAKAWNPVRRSYEVKQEATTLGNVHLITECMHVTSEEGEFSFIKLPPTRSTSSWKGTGGGRGLGESWSGLIEMESDTMLAGDGSGGEPLVANGGGGGGGPAATVCGVYFVADPDQIIEITMKQVNVECRTGGLMAFVDGWELNGQYFPGEQDHEQRLERRVQEFCSEQAPPQWSTKAVTPAKVWVFRSSQNCALVQYRIPVRGSFVISARFLHNSKPCHIMAEGLAPYYMLRNYGQPKNCTLTALFPAVVSVIALEVGPVDKNVHYCERVRSDDKLEVGGSTGLDPHQMIKASTICGRSGGRMDLDQSILCGTTSVRLVSSGQYNNQAMITIRMAEEADLRLAAVMCAM